MGGKWISLEILNIPWSKELLDFTSEVFKNAKYVVERAVSKIVHISLKCYIFNMFFVFFLQFDMAYIKNDKTFPEGFVRTIVMRFYEGYIPLNEKWQEAIGLAQNATNNTNLTSLDNWPEDAMMGEPIIGLFEPEFEEGQRGVSETQFKSTMVDVSFDF